MQWHKKVCPNSAEQKPSSLYNPGQYIMVGNYFETISFSFRLSSLFNLCSLEKCLFLEVHISMSNVLRAFSPWSLLSTCKYYYYCITICAVSKKNRRLSLISLYKYKYANSVQSQNRWDSQILRQWSLSPLLSRPGQSQRLLYKQLCH